MLFRRLLGVPMVSAEFVTYRDAFLFALSVHWDVDVAKYDLTPEQSQAAFAFVDLLAADLTYGRAGLTSGRRPRRGGRQLQRRGILRTPTTPPKENVPATRMASLRSPTSTR